MRQILTQYTVHTAEKRLYWTIAYTAHTLQPYIQTQFKHIYNTYIDSRHAIIYICRIATSTV